MTLYAPAIRALVSGKEADRVAGLLVGDYKDTPSERAAAAVECISFCIVRTFYAVDEKFLDYFECDIIETWIASVDLSGDLVQRDAKASVLKDASCVAFAYLAVFGTHGFFPEYAIRAVAFMAFENRLSMISGQTQRFPSLHELSLWLAYPGLSCSLEREGWPGVLANFCSKFDRLLSCAPIDKQGALNAFDREIYPSERWSADVVRFAKIACIAK